MTTLPNRPNSTLLVVDVQTGVVENAHDRDRVVANIAGLVERARREQVPVVWVQHTDEQLVHGSDSWRIVSELSPGAEEPLIEKNWGDSFEETDLERVLAELEVGRLIVVGAQTDQCIRSTLHGALVRGYDATLVSDPVPTTFSDVGLHKLDYRALKAPNRRNWVTLSGGGRGLYLRPVAAILAP